jgi:hemoglobin/transferrin/lactoferrin receptor protein
MMKIHISFVFLLLVLFINSQEIIVIDKTTQISIPGVLVSSPNTINKLKTDIDGKVDISVYKPKDSIYFTYPNYVKIGFKKGDLSSIKYIELYEDAMSLNEVIVTGNRWEQNKRSIPNRIEKLQVKDITFLNPQTSADLLESSGYVFVQKSQLAGGSPQLRGFGTNRVMIVVDGVRMNNAIYRSGNLQNVISLDASSLEAAEILFGPGAVMYGSDAIGGVMDFRTKEAKFSDKNQVNGNVFARYSSANKEFTRHANFNFSSKKIAFVTDVTFSEFGDLMMGRNGGDSSFLRPTYQKSSGGKDSTFVNNNPYLQVNSAYNQTNLLQKIRFKFSENVDLEYSFNYSTTSNAPRYDRLILDQNKDGKLDFAEWYYGPQKWMMNRMALQFNKSVLVADKIRLIVAHQNYEESRHDRRFNNSRLRSQEENVKIISANLELNKTISSKAELSYGAEFVHNGIFSKGYRTHIQTLNVDTINSRYPNNSTWMSTGLYANFKYFITEKLVLNSGVRYSYVASTAKFDTTLFTYPFTEAVNKNGALNGSLGLVYNPLSNLQLYMNTSTGFRAPNLDDIGKVFESQPGYIVVPNANLKPEYAYNGELGFVTSIANRIKVDGVVYYTYLKNALVRNSFQIDGKDSMLFDGQMSQILAIQNASNAHVMGFQGGIEVSIIKGLTLKSTISFQKGREFNLDSNRYFPKSHVAPTFGRTSLIYQIRKFKAECYVNYNGKMLSSQFPISDLQDNAIFAKDSNGDPFTPSWYTLNLKMAYYPNKNIQISAGIENITDQMYRSFGSGITAPGRNFILTLRGNF